jgi:hypothetical protein
MRKLFCDSGMKGGGLSWLLLDMGVMERSRCSGEMLNNPTPFPGGIKRCPAPFSVEHSFLFHFGVLHNSSCSGKKKTLFIIFCMFYYTKPNSN